MSSVLPNDHVVLLTGHLAYDRVMAVMAGFSTGTFTWEVLDVGVKVAALMTEEIIRRRVSLPERADTGGGAGRCRADLDALAAFFGVPVERGTRRGDRLPQFFGRGAKRRDLSGHDLRIFAEIVEAPRRPSRRFSPVPTRTGGRCRRHRHRRSAGHALSPSRRARPGAEAAGLSRLHRQRRHRGDRDGRARRRRLHPLAQRGHGGAGAGPCRRSVIVPAKPAISTASSAPASGWRFSACPTWPIDPRPHPLRFHRVDRPLSRLPPADAASRDADGHRNLTN